MNPRRSFFRLWVVASALFALGTGTLFVQPIHKEFQRQEVMNLPAILMVPVSCKEARGRDGADYERLGLEENRPDLCWYQLAQFRANYPEYDRLNENELSDAMYGRAGLPVFPPPTPWRLVAFAASLALGIPLAALVLGSAIGWVLAGFKK